MSDRLIDNAPTMYCHQLVRIGKLGPNRLLVFAVPSLDYPGCREVQVKQVVPAELMTTLAYLCAGADRDTISRELIALEPRTAN